MNVGLKPNLLTPRWRKVVSDLWGDKTRTGLVVASIAVGVFAIGMIITTFVILAEDINRSYAAVNPPNIVVWTDPFDNAFISLRTLDTFGLGSQFEQLYITVAGGTQREPIARVAVQIKDQVEDSQREVYRMEEKLSNEHPITSFPFYAVTWASPQTDC